MKIFLLLFGLIIGYTTGASAQTRNDSAYLDDLNRFIDHAVVKKDKAALDTLYANDFMFTHGTGHIDHKESWINGVTAANAHYLSREHDSTIVEVHPATAMIYGKLTIVRMDGDKKLKYAIKYVRVFLLNRGNWQMISHRTVQQWDNLPL